MSKTEFEFDTSGELPDGWEWIPLDKLMEEPKKDIVDGPFGSNLKASEYVDEGIPIARLQNINRNAFIHKNIKFVTQDKAAQLARHTFKPGDVLITKLGDPLGKACIAPAAIDHGVIVADLVRVRPSQRKVDRQYLTYVVNSPLVARQFEKHTKGTTRPRVNLGMIRQLPIPVAPREMQEAVVAEIEKQFSRLDEAVASLKRVKANLKRYRAAVLKAAVEGRLVETEAEIARREGRSFETGEQLLQRILETRRSQWDGKGKYKEPAAPDTADLPELPEGWGWTNFDQVTERITKGSSPNWQGFDYCQEGIPFVRSQNVGWGVTDLSDIAYLPPGFNDVEKKAVLQEGDLLLNIVGASIGRAAIAPSDVEGGNVNQAVAVIRLLAIEVSNRFVLLYLLSAQSQRRIHSEKVDVARANFSLEDIREMPLALPPSVEQDRIVAEVERHLSLIREAEQQVDVNLKRAERMRQSILASAFSGKLV